ncbi:hypothetical protein [Vagococcus fluvialis]|uniref:hypothetical protein n=1 Tax=Vagococcus fluvialis TaxID=2738 RepID=UPI0037CECBFF
MCKSRRYAVILATYLLGMSITIVNLKLAILIGIVTSFLWLMNHDEVSYQKNTKRGNQHE